MKTGLYLVWALLPLAYLLIGLWALLEKAGGSSKRQNPSDFFRQLVFVGAAVGASIALNEWFVIPSLPAMLPEFIPVTLVQLLLLPAVLYLGAMLVGGSKPIRIERATHVSQNRRKR